MLKHSTTRSGTFDEERRGISHDPFNAQTNLTTQMDRIERTVNDLTTKLDVVIEQGASNEVHLTDLKSELKHYGTLVSNLTHHLKENQNRLTLLFWVLGFVSVGVIFWIIAHI